MAKKLVTIEVKANGKTPVFQGNHPSGRNALFQGKILLKQKRYSFLYAKADEKFIRML